MATAKDVAEWMVVQLDDSTYAYQEMVVYQTKKQFGDDFVYFNENGNLAIGKDVLREFRKATEGKVVWERTERRAWRKLHAGEGRLNNCVLNSSLQPTVILLAVG
jgi:hypothetical protein